MPLDFSLFADDMVMEILGNLPALDIVRFRRVCRRIFLASKERSVWTNAFSEAQCLIPGVNVDTMSTKDIENLLVRMEIMDAKWTGVRPTTPREIETRPHLVDHCVSLPPYVAWVSPHSGPVVCKWYRADDLETPVLEYQQAASIHCHTVDIGGNALHIAYMEHPRATGFSDQEDKKARRLKIVKFEVLKGQVVSKTAERDILWTTSTIPRATIFQLKMLDGYVLIQSDINGLWPIDILHIDTGRTFICPAHPGMERYQLFIARSTTSSYLIRHSSTNIFFYEFPSQEETQNSTSTPTLRLTHRGSFPQELSHVRIFPRSASTFIVVGLTKVHAPEESVGLHLITINLSQYSSACDMHENFCYEARGETVSYALASCSPTSRSTLGILTVQSRPPTHTTSGMRIARTSTQYRQYHLGVRVDFGQQGHSSPKIDLTEIDLFHSNNIEAQAIVRYFNPYAGQVTMDVSERVRGHSRNRTVTVMDYISP